jgi:hypothetical protein
MSGWRARHTLKRLFWMSRVDRLARSVTKALLAGEWTLEDLNRRAALFFGRQQRADRRRLIRDLIQKAPTLYSPSPAWLLTHLLSSEIFFRLSSAKQASERPLFIELEAPPFTPLDTFSKLEIPGLRAPGDLGRVNTIFHSVFLLTDWNE